jgi:hypothetical protein
MNYLVGNYKGLLLFFILLYSSQNHLVAQENTAPKKPFFEHVRYGGSLGANFSNGYFSAFLAPKAIYDFNRYTSAGVGVAASYTSTSRYSAFTTGASILGLFRPLQALQLSAEFEEQYVSRDFKLEGQNLDDTYWYPALYLGLGYTTGHITVGVRYDVLYDDEKSIYSNALMPFVSVFF